MTHKLKYGVAVFILNLNSFAFAQSAIDTLSDIYQDNFLFINNDTLRKDHTEIGVNSNVTFLNSSTGNILGIHVSNNRDYLPEFNGIANPDSAFNGVAYSEMTSEERSYYRQNVGSYIAPVALWGSKSVLINDHFMSGMGLAAVFGGDKNFILNNGTVNTYSYAFTIWNSPTRTTAINNGFINVNDDGGVGFVNFARTGLGSAYTNNGTINLNATGAVAFQSVSPYTILTNNGSINGSQGNTGFQIQPYPWSIDYSGSYQNITNGLNGVIDIGANGKAISIATNNGIDVGGGGDLTNQNVGSTIINSGQIILGQGSYGVYLDNANGVQFQNGGSISLTGENSIGVYVSPTSSITSLMNTGSIKGSGLNAFGIKNDGVIGSLTNSQGNSSAGSSPLTLTGNMPSAYNQVINTVSNYGQLSLFNVSGKSVFSIDASSNANPGIYKSTVSGVNSINDYFDNAVGNYNGLTYNLLPDRSTRGVWDLYICPTGPCVNTTSYTTVNPANNAIQNGTLGQAWDTGSLVSSLILTNNGSIANADMPAISSQTANVVITNNGDITTSGRSPAISSLGDNAVVTNNGTITTSGQLEGPGYVGGRAVTVYGGNNFTVNNNGLIKTNSGWGEPIHITLDGTNTNAPVDFVGTINNSGSLIANSDANNSDYTSNGILVTNNTNRNNGPGQTGSVFISNTEQGIISAPNQFGIYLQNLDDNSAPKFTANVTNSGSISGAWGIYSDYQLNLVNNGTITSTGSGNAAIQTSAGYINLTNNTDAIISGDNGVIVGGNLGGVSVIENFGSILANNGYGITNSGTISKLVNGQGGVQSSGAPAPLTFTGTLPSNYFIFIASKTRYGQLAASNVTAASSGPMIFGIYGGGVNGVLPSILENHTYTAVLSGFDQTQNLIDPSTLSGVYTGTSGGTWALNSQSADATIWDLKVKGVVSTSAPQDLTPGSNNSTSSLSGASTVSISGGKLSSDANATITAPVTLTGSSPVTLDPAGFGTNFSAAITSTGTAPLNIQSSTGGTITLNAGGNIIPGGVTVSGGTLAIGDASNPNASLTADVALSANSVLKGHGSITGQVSNAGGTVSPGGSIGTTTINGSYSQTPTSTLSIEINPTQNSLLQVNGPATIAGTLDIVATAGTYAPKKYTIMTATGGLSGTFSTLTNNLSTFTAMAYKVTYDALNAYLNLYAFTLADTQSSVSAVTSNLKKIFNLESAAVTNAMTADCSVFDKNVICLSVGGRYTSSNNSSSDNATLAIAYKLDDNFRIGAYVDQSVGTNTVGTIKINGSSPVLGAFAVWAQNPDQKGFQVRINTAYGTKNLDITRSSFNSSESASASSNITTKGISATLSYDHPIVGNLIVSPYIGMRYLGQRLDAYSENASATVTAPLSYSRVSQTSTTAMAGIGLLNRFDNNIGLFGKLGLEQDLGKSRGKIVASGIDGLSDVAMSTENQKIRPTVSGGVFYDIDKTQRITANASYGKQPFQNSATLSTMVSYQIGF